MACLKCGKDTEEANAFCGGCLEEMKNHPVKPGTAVLLPQRQAEPERKKVRRTRTLKEENIRLRRRIRALGWALFVALAGVAALSALLLLRW